ncbi:hypothetical protein NW801_02305 [Brevibacillus laterosporus]|uniref:Uncharacterized protein n=2 Tax=Brevibacillus TaxID=55080 RepID=A0A0F7EGU4_BRELA|nr:MULTISPECIES: hypothetical protein [Brevibacillus]AKF94362.1 hypothetical protein EX87_12485 [Brevibacillus laterosporus]MCR8983911.1 hypothetical protein [Brevibacillus laterosporus]MCZ0829630.1 hypothetical protein [Brevibacillus halotolerans]
MVPLVYGVEIEMPKGKLPGFYAQFVHKIGEQVKVIDRDKKLMIVSTEDDQQQLLQIAARYQAETECFSLWLLPEGVTSPRLSDYGFISLHDRQYVYANLVSFFRFSANPLTHDHQEAYEQMEQYILVSFTAKDQTIYIVDTNHKELLDQLASRYKVILDWHPGIPSV